MQMQITRWDSFKAVTGVRRSVSWDADFVNAARLPAVVPAGSDVPVWSPAVFRNNIRSEGHCETLSALVLDCDQDGVDRVAEVWRNFTVLIHATRNSRPGAERCRVILPFIRPATPDEYLRLWDWAEEKSRTRGIIVDRATRGVGRVWFDCVQFDNASYTLRAFAGTLLDSDALFERSRAEAPARAFVDKLHEGLRPVDWSADADGAAVRVLRERVPLLDELLRNIERAPVGYRSSALHINALQLYRHVLGETVLVEIATRLLADAGLDNELPLSEVDHVLEAAYRNAVAAGLAPAGKAENKPVNETETRGGCAFCGRDDLSPPLLFGKGNRACICLRCAQEAVVALGPPVSSASSPDEGNVKYIASSVWTAAAAHALALGRSSIPTRLECETAVRQYLADQNAGTCTGAEPSK